MATVKKRKLKYKNIIKLFAVVLIGVLIYYLLSTIHIKTITVNGENVLSEMEIIREAKLDGYPKIYSKNAKKAQENLLKDPLIKKVRIKKSWFVNMIIDVTEYEVYFKTEDKYILSNNKSITSSNDIDVPYITFDTTEKVHKTFMKYYAKIDKSITNNISEIIYTPSVYDDTLYTFIMKDDNSVYVPASKFDYLNEYELYITKFGDVKGLIDLEMTPFITPY